MATGLGGRLMDPLLTPKSHKTIKRNSIIEYMKYLVEHKSSICIPVSNDILKLETLSNELLFSFIHALPICEADKVVLNVHNKRKFLF